MENEELDLDLNEETLKANNRYQQLSEKVKTTANERDEATKGKQAEAERATKAEKERDFYKDFSQLSSKHPHAAAYQDKILEKVNAGYSAEDATFAVLGKEGKLGGGMAPIASHDNVAGGSAATAMTDFDKEPDQMSKDEKREALMQLEKEGKNLLKF